MENHRYTVRVYRQAPVHVSVGDRMEPSVALRTFQGGTFRSMHLPYFTNTFSVCVVDVSLRILRVCPTPTYAHASL
eukprot:33169-Eustigmatos_ZCMA.PRE.1